MAGLAQYPILSPRLSRYALTDTPPLDIDPALNYFFGQSKDWLRAGVEATATSAAAAATLPAQGKIVATVATASASAASIQLPIPTTLAASTAAALAHAVFIRAPAALRAGTNRVPNPSFELDTTGWTSVSGTLTQDTTRAWVGSSSGRLNVTGGSSSVTGTVDVTGLPLSGVAQVVTLKVRLWYPTGQPASSPSVNISVDYTDASQTFLFTPVTPFDGWQDITVSLTTNPAKTINFINAYPVVFLVAGSVVWIDGVDLRVGEPDCDDYIDGAPGGQYQWTGAAHASMSTRASILGTATAAAGAAMLTGAARTVAHSARNRLRNPSFETNTTFWNVQLGNVVTRDNAESWSGTWSGRIDVTTAGSATCYQTADLTGLTLTGIPHLVTAKLRVKGPAGSILPQTARIYVTYSSGGAQTLFLTNVALTGEWQELTAPPLTTDDTRTITGINLYAEVNATSPPAPFSFYVDGADLRIDEPDVDDYVDGSQGTGYAWTGVANASTSTRSNVLVPANSLAIVGLATLPAQGKIAATVATATASAGASTFVAIATPVLATATATASAGSALFLGNSALKAVVTSATTQVNVSALTGLAVVSATISTATTVAPSATLSGAVSAKLIATVATATSGAGAATLLGNALVSATVATATSAAGASIPNGAARVSAVMSTATASANTAAFAFGVNLVAITATATSAAQSSVLRGSATLNAVVTTANSSAGLASFKAIAIFNETVATATALAQDSAIQAATGAGISASSASATAMTPSAKIVVVATFGAATATSGAQAGIAAVRGQALLSPVVTTSTTVAGAAALSGQALSSALIISALAQAESARLRGALVIVAQPATASTLAQQSVLTGGFGAFLRADVAASSTAAQPALLRGDAVVAASGATATAQAGIADLPSAATGYLLSAIDLVAPIQATAIAQLALTGRAQIVVIDGEPTHPEVVEVITIRTETLVGLTANVGINDDDCP